MVQMQKNICIRSHKFLRNKFTKNIIADGCSHNVSDTFLLAIFT